MRTSLVVAALSLVVAVPNAWAQGRGKAAHKRHEAAAASHQRSHRGGSSSSSSSVAPAPAPASSSGPSTRASALEADDAGGGGSASAEKSDEGAAASAGGTKHMPAKTNEYSFTGLDVEGKLKTPQLLYFLNRVKLELEMSAPDHRSFMKELEKSADDSHL